MGYSSNPRTIEKILPYLDRLVRGEPCEWTFDTTEQAKDFAYKLREALNIAQDYPQDYPDLARARAKFSIKLLREEKLVRTVPRKSYAPQGLTAAIPGSKIIGGSPVVEGKQTPMTIIQSWMQRPPDCTKVSFPEAGLTDLEISTVARWAATRTSDTAPHGWVVVSNPPILVLTVWDADLAAIAVKP